LLLKTQNWKERKNCVSKTPKIWKNEIETPKKKFPVIKKPPEFKGNLPKNSRKEGNWTPHRAPNCWEKFGKRNYIKPNFFWPQRVGNLKKRLFLGPKMG